MNRVVFKAGKGVVKVVTSKMFKKELIKCVVASGLNISFKVLSKKTIDSILRTKGYMKPDEFLGRKAYEVVVLKEDGSQMSDEEVQTALENYKNKQN